MRVETYSLPLFSIHTRRFPPLPFLLDAFVKNKVGTCKQNLSTLPNHAWNFSITAHPVGKKKKEDIAHL